MFQATIADRDDTLRLLRGLNTTLVPAVPDDRLLKLFDRFWPDLDTVIAAARSSTTSAAKPTRDPNEVLDEILNTVRGLARGFPDLAWQTSDPRSFEEWFDAMQGRDYDAARYEDAVRRLDRAFDNVRSKHAAADFVELVRMSRDARKEPKAEE